MEPEAWLRGPIQGIDPYLLPAAHALIQSGEDIQQAATDLTVEELWIAPGGAASAGFHLRHIAGSIDRLLTYAAGSALSNEQRQALELEGLPGDPLAEAALLIGEAQAAIARALETIRGVRRNELLEERTVGRAHLPSNVLGLLFHIAEHTQRHAGQLITTAKIVRGLNLAGRE
jgi:uncharacterized damage-inducible protein DinB